MKNNKYDYINYMYQTDIQNIIKTKKLEKDAYLKIKQIIRQIPKYTIDEKPVSRYLELLVFNDKRNTQKVGITKNKNTTDYIQKSDQIMLSLYMKKNRFIKSGQALVFRFDNTNEFLDFISLFDTKTKEVTSYVLLRLGL